VCWQQTHACMQARRVANGVAIEWAFQREGAFVRLRALLICWLTALPMMLAQALVFKKIRAVRHAWIPPRTDSCMPQA
jgi:hypothetical protein